MHMAVIGLFGTHICNSIVHKIRTTLRNESFIKGRTTEGNPIYIISEAALEDVFDRLCERLQHFRSTRSGFQLTIKYTAHFKSVFLRGKGTFTAGRMLLLMMALPFALRDLLNQELASIRRVLPRAAVEDPCPGMVRALNSFLDFFTMGRSMLIPVADLPELTIRHSTMLQDLKDVFPNKSGEKSATPWNFPKAHAGVHLPREFVTFGSTSGTSTETFEAGHRPNVKALAGLTNGKDQFMSISSHHDRTMSLAKLNDAVKRNTKRLARQSGKTEGDDSSSDNSSEAGGSDDDDDLSFDQRSSRPCELAAKQPLWDMTFHLKSLHKNVEAMGRRGRGRQRLVSAACKAGAPAPSARRDRPDSTRFSYNASDQCPDLKFLPTQLAHYAYEYLGQQLGLEDLPEERRDLDGVLKNCLVPDQDRSDIFTFGGMAIRSDHWRGTVRIRARPFADDNFHGSNPQVSLSLSLCFLPLLYHDIPK